MVWISW